MNSGPPGSSRMEGDSIRSCSECKVCASLQRCGWTSTAWEGKVRTHPYNSSVAQSNISAEETASRRRSQETGGGRATGQSRLNDQAGEMDQLGGPGEEKAQLAGHLGDGGSTAEFCHQSHIRPATLPQNLKELYGEDPACSLCQVPASLRHFLSGCTTSLTKGCYTWRHNQVLRELASILEQKRTTTNNHPQILARQVNFTKFVPAGQHQVHRTTPKDASILQSAWDWKLQVDLDKKLMFPPEIMATTLRPDMVL